MRLTPDRTAGLIPVALLAIITLLIPHSQPLADDTGDPWRTLEPGLSWGVFLSPVESQRGDSRIRALRVDPDHFEISLLCASAPDRGHNLSARDWCRQEGLVAAINAGMYAKDHRTAVSLMKTGQHVNNRHLTRHKSVLLFDCSIDSMPAARIIDLTCTDLQELSPFYGSQVQSIRMISCAGDNTWEQQERRWSSALVGEDRQGRILFIFTRSLYTMHDLIDILRDLPLDLVRLQYGEGGPEAQLCVDTGNFNFYDCGRFEQGFLDSDASSAAWPVPNVLGIARKTAIQSPDVESSK